VFGVEFDKLYESYEQAGKGRKTVRARDVWSAIITSQIETGTPYLLSKTRANMRSNQKNLGTIKCSNLCVAPNTPVLTRQGYYPISSMAGEEVEVWNGSEFSKTTIMQTGAYQDMVRVKFSNEMEIDCTPYHKFHIVTGARDTKHVVVSAADLNRGDRLVKCTYPVLDGHKEYDMEYPYTHGFFCGDGTYQNAHHDHDTRPCAFKSLDGERYCKRHLMHKAEGRESGAEEGRCQALSYEPYPSVSLYGEKKKLLPFLDVRSTSGIEDAIGKLNCMLPANLAPKYEVPLNASVYCKLQWLAGLADADGCVVTVDANESIQISSTHLKMLQDTLLMLQTLGVNSNIRVMHEKRVAALPDGRGGTAEFDCQRCCRIFIKNSDLIHLKSLGFTTKRLKFQMNNIPNRDASRFIRVASVETLPHKSDTYCFNEPKKQRGIFGGVLTGNCSEIIQYTAPDEVSVCNLASLNLAAFVKEGKYDFDHLKEVAGIVTRNLDKVIDVNFYPIEEARNSNMRHRPVGLGVQGLADTFALLSLPFDSPEAAQLNEEIFETIYFGAVQASVALAEEKGSYSSYEGSPASQGLLQFDLDGAQPTSGRWDWSVLKEQMKEHGLRNSLLTAVMPTASTSQILGNNESVEAFTSMCYLRRTSAGEFSIVNKHLVKELCKLELWTAELRNQLLADKGSVQQLAIPKHLREVFKTTWELSPKAAINHSADRQKYISQSQSTNIFCAEPSLGRVSSIHFYSWKKGLVTLSYYLRIKTKAEAIQFTVDTKAADRSRAAARAAADKVCTRTMREAGCESCSS
jgi:ribonucleoside-diphosphate reductase alpha chain